MGFLQKIIRNDAMKTDPHEIYNWRVFALACAVSSITSEGNSYTDRTHTGLFRGHAFRHGYWHYWWCADDAIFQRVYMVHELIIMGTNTL